MKEFRIGILGSTRGTDLIEIITAIQKKNLAASIEIVISNKNDAGILDKAKNYNLQNVFVDPAGLAREAYDAKISEILAANRIDLIVLIGYMRILSNDFVRAWRGKIINVHPALLPAFAGSMDGDVHQAVLASGVKETGCTVHYVDETIDAGPIILQKKCPVLPNDTVETLKARVQKLEGEALVEAIQARIHERK